MGNGYAISAIVGNNKYLDKLSDTFASSTAWTERVGFAAAEATIDFFVKKKVHLHINEMGENIIKEWSRIAKKKNIKITIGNYLAIPNFKFKYKHANKLSTIFSYEMLKRGYLATNSVYLSYSHKKETIKEYLKNFEKVFDIIKKILNNEVKYPNIKEKSFI